MATNDNIISRVSKRGVFKAIRFCPWCGVESLDRDEYRRDHGAIKSRNGRVSYEHSAPEWVCRTCGAGFQIKPSLRHTHAADLFAEHRKMRPR